jgi:prepilin-type N-terminal cleavage/methylation domain-containing protein
MMKIGHLTPRSDLINARGCSHGAVRRPRRVSSNETNAPQERGYNFCDPPPAQNAHHGFTLVELLISIVVVTIIVLMVAQLMSNATAVARTGNKHIDTDTQARIVLDQMAVDFAKMLKRTDIDYYIKVPLGYKNPNANGKGKKLKSGQLGNDQIAFFAETPGYYPPGSQSPLSLVAYRIDDVPTSATYLQLVRMAKGLLWNGVNNGTTSTSPYPIVFATRQIDLSCTNKCPCNGTTGPWAGPWSAALCDDTADTDYETIGPGVFRFEYYYLLKDGSITDAPRVTSAAVNWSPTDPIPLSAKLNAFSDVEAIAVVIAVIDPASRSLVFQSGALFNLMSDMADFKNANGKGFGAHRIGDVENNWNLAVQSAAQTGATSDGSAFPRAAASAVRIYNRYFDVRTLPNL